MIDHLSVVVSDYAKSKAFYSQALAPTGHSRVVELPATREGQKESAGFCHADGSDFWISQGEAVTPPIHIAFRVSSREAVDAFYKAAIAAGGKDNGAPGLRPHYHPNYYGAFVLDPDGHNIEAVCHEAQ
jgi:catechol 2,3-dioxygenase-like lactoylglutathione lyase family enzyme